MKNNNVYRFVRRKYIWLYEKIICFRTDIYFKGKWKKKDKHECLNNIPRDKKIVITLTSFPARISHCHKTIRTLLLQNNVKPDVVELWLAKEEFPYMEKELPHQLLDLCEVGLSICWCENIRSYKKLLPSLEKHEEDIIVTVDDDVYYDEDWLEKLWCSYNEYPKSIHCHKATQFYRRDDNWEYIGGGQHYYEKPSYLNKLVGVGGVLYPPGSLDSMVLDKDICMELAPTNDDIWFWLMAVKNGTTVKVCTNPEPSPIEVFSFKHDVRLCDINDCVNGLFREQLNNILNFYPDINNKMLDEWNTREKKHL